MDITVLAARILRRVASAICSVITPVIRSGREETYVPGKDTGRYWDAGATNVHWVIATEEQVGKGILDALKLVRTDGVFIEGNSFSEYVDVDLMIMVASAAGEQIKKSARPALARSAALFVSGGTTLKAEPVEQERFEKWLRTSSRVSYASSLPIYSWADLPQLVAEVQRVSSSMPGNPDKIWASKVGQSNTAS